MPNWSVKWNNADLITPAEGVATFTRGKFPRIWQVKHLPRALRDRMNDMGRGSAEHKLLLQFTDVPTASVDDIFSRFENLLHPAAPDSATLVITDRLGATLHSLQHCVFEDYEPGEQPTRSKVTGQGLAQACYWDLSFTLTFRQTRP